MGVSKYSEAYPGLLIEKMSDGFSITATAGEFGVPRKRLYEWAEQHPEFAEAMEIGRAKRVLKLEGTLLDIGNGKIEAPPAPAIFALKNADPDEWRERREPSVVIANLDTSDTELAQRIAFLLLAANRGNGAAPVPAMIEGQANGRNQRDQP